MNVRELKEQLNLANEEDDVIVIGSFGIRSYIRKTYSENLPTVKRRNIFTIDAYMSSIRLVDESWIEDAILRTESILDELKDLYELMKETK